MRQLLLLLVLSLYGIARAQEPTFPAVSSVPLTSWRNIGNLAVPQCAFACLEQEQVADPDVLCSDGPDQAQNVVLKCMHGSSCEGQDFANAGFSSSISASLCSSTTTSSSTSTSSTSLTSSTTTSSSSSSSSSSSTPIPSSTSSAEPSATLSLASPTSVDSEKDVVSSGGSSGLSGGAIAGIVIGCLALIALFLLGLWLVLRRRRQQQAPSRSLALEPASPPGAGAPAWTPPSMRQGWETIGSSSSTPTVGASGNWRSSTPALAPINIYAANNEKVEDSNGRGAAGSGEYGISISVSPVSPATTPSLQSRTSDIPHNLYPPVPPTAPFLDFDFSYTQNESYTDLQEHAPPVSPVSPPGTGYGNRDSIGTSVISIDDVVNSPPIPPYDLPPFSQQELQNYYNEGEATPKRHTCSTPAMVPVGIGGRIQPASPPPKDITRADSVSWRRQVDEAAARASTRVVQSEQAADSNSKANRPGALEKLTQRWSGGDGGGETTPWVPPKSPGFLGRKRVSNGSGRESGIVIV